MISRPDEGHRHLRHARAAARCSPAARPRAAEERRCATDTCARLADQALPRPGRAPTDMADLMKFYDQGRKDGGDFENGIRLAVQGILANPRFLFRVEQQPEVPAGTQLPHRRSRARLAPVVLPVGHGARCRAGEGGDVGTLKTAAGARPAGAPHAGRPEGRGPGHPLRRRSGCACRTSRRCGPTASSIPQWDQSLTDSMRQRDRALLRQPGPRGPQRARPAQRRLHLRERAAGAPLRLSPTSPARVPPRHAAADRAAASSRRAAS